MHYCTCYAIFIKSYTHTEIYSCVHTHIQAYLCERYSLCVCVYVVRTNTTFLGAFVQRLLQCDVFGLEWNTHTRLALQTHTHTQIYKHHIAAAPLSLRLCILYNFYTLSTHVYTHKSIYLNIYMISVYRYINCTFIQAHNFAQRKLQHGCAMMGGKLSSPLYSYTVYDGLFHYISMCDFGFCLKYFIYLLIYMLVIGTFQNKLKRGASSS